MSKKIKVGIVIFHRNIEKIYKKRWIDICVDSILNQSYKDFYLYEINYGGSSQSIFKQKKIKNHVFYSDALGNYAEAMNFIISKSFEDGCDYVFNTNLDDLYHSEKIENQLKYAVNGGYDIVSCDFCYIEESINNGREIDTITHFLNVSNLLPEINENFNAGNNIICHPGVCYSKKFWEKNRYDALKIPSEDFDLWKKSILNGYKFGILPGVYLHYRLHKNQISKGHIEN